MAIKAAGQAPQSTGRGRAAAPAATGEVEVPLTALDQVEAAAELFKKRGLKSIVICFLFSFLNSEHEAQARDVVRRVIPDAFVLLFA